MKLLRGLLAAALVAACLFVARIPAGAAPEQVGRWSAPGDLGIVGVHGAVLHTGKVLLYSGTEGESAGSVARLFDPATGAVEPVSIPFEHPAFCSGVTVLPDGRVMVMGGQLDLQIGHGVRDVSIFDPGTETWSQGAPMRFARYYPSVVELADGRSLVVAGTDEDGQEEVPQLEVYDPATDAWSTLPSSANQTSPSYPRLVLLPSGRVARVSELPMTRVFDPVTNTWSDVSEMRYGNRYTGAHVLLPGLNRVLVAGGQKGVKATATAEVIDMSASKPVWRYTGSMRKARDNLNLVLLPDGTVLAVGGGLNSLYLTAMKEAELYDPATGKWRLMAAQQVQRTYHSTAFLLPDGRVLSAGSDFGINSETYEIFTPPYLFRGRRPVTGAVPSTLTYGQTFTIASGDAAQIKRVALIRPSATTHADNFDQRYVDLAFTAASDSLAVTAPTSGSQAPPGYYMLFILNEAGVPSVATFVHLG